MKRKYNHLVTDSTAFIAKTKHLSSVVSYPDRGPWGDSRYRGNCSGHLVKDLILRFNCQSVFNPAEGSGTVRDVVAGLNRYRQKSISYEGRDLKTGHDILTDPMPSRQFDMVWFHPPYWDIIRYSSNPGDLGNCATLGDFEDKLNRSAEKLTETLRPGGILVILIGDKRKHDRYYPMFRTLLNNPNIGLLAKQELVKLRYSPTRLPRYVSLSSVPRCFAGNRFYTLELFRAYRP